MSVTSEREGSKDFLSLLFLVFILTRLSSQTCPCCVFCRIHTEGWRKRKSRNLRVFITKKMFSRNLRNTQRNLWQMTCCHSSLQRMIVREDLWCYSWKHLRNFCRDGHCFFRWVKALKWIKHLLFSLLCFFSLRLLHTLVCLTRCFKNVGNQLGLPIVFPFVCSK